jgi:hypothetical protein
MKIEILYFEGCPHHEPAERAVRDILEELNVEAEISHVDVRDETTAERVRFPGSPTIRVDGEDVARAETNGSYSLRCRVYQTSSGMAGVPDKDAIRAAIRRRVA